MVAGELTERYLAILRGRGIGAVFVEEDGTADVVVREALTEESRGEATTLIESQGGRVTSGVSRATSVVVVGDEAGSKLDKAVAR